MRNMGQREGRRKVIPFRSLTMLAANRIARVRYDVALGAAGGSHRASARYITPSLRSKASIAAISLRLARGS